MMFSFSTFYLEQNRTETNTLPYPGIHPPPQAMQPNHNPQPGPPARQQQRGRPIPFPPLVNTIILSVLVIGFDTGLRLIVRWTKLEQEKTILQKENIQNQLAFLRNQVSPHFFMNTLNNIHALIDINAEEAKTAIIKLSKLMRHLLYDADTDFTPLKKEVEFIKSYINLMMLRFPEKVKITLDIAEDIPDRQIPPLLYTSLIENAFKHGISYTSNSFIHIRLSFSGNRLLFEIRNSNPHFSGKHASESIGLENTRKRLDLIYHDKYDFEITRNDEIFTVKLIIPL
jgi:LytS/YehU family sensor histidine kinase